MVRCGGGLERIAREEEVVCQVATGQKRKSSAEKRQVGKSPASQQRDPDPSPQRNPVDVTDHGRIAKKNSGAEKQQSRTLRMPLRRVVRDEGAKHEERGRDVGTKRGRVVTEKKT